MIASINRDPFDGVFFFEEEFDKIVPHLGKVLPHRSLVSSVLKYYYGSDLDLHNMVMRETSIWPSKFEEEKAVTLPFRRVYFVSNFCPIEELMKKNIPMKAVIGFQTCDAELGSVIILEDFLKYFFRGKLYIYFDKDGNILPLDGEHEEKLFDIQMGFISQFVRFFRKFYAKYCYPCSLSRPNLVIANTPGDIGRYAGILEFPELLVLASLRRWMFQSTNHLMGLSEFDNHFMISFLSSYLHTKSWNSYSGRGMIWTEPKVVKALSSIVLQMMKILESQKLRDLDLTRRYMEFHKELDNISFDTKDKEELEGIIKNVREKSPVLPPGVDIWPAPDAVKRYPWK